MSTSSPSTSAPRRSAVSRCGVLARHPDGERAVGVDQADDIPIDLTDQHHSDHVHRLGGGDAKAAAKLGLHAEPVEVGRDLRSAAVHDDDAQSGVAQEDDVLGERLAQRRHRPSRDRRT